MASLIMLTRITKIFLFHLNVLVLTGMAPTRLNGGPGSSDGIYHLLDSEVGIIGGTAVDAQYHIIGFGASIVGESYDDEFKISSPRFRSSITDRIEFITDLSDTIQGDRWSLALRIPGIDSRVTCHLHYRGGGKTTFKEVALRPDSGLFSTEVPLGAIRQRGIEYYLSIVSGGRSALIGSPVNPLRVVTSFNPADSPLISVPAQAYRMISLPVLADSISQYERIEQLFGVINPTVWRLGRFDPTTSSVKEYPDIPSPTPGTSYWLITKNQMSIESPGYSVFPNVVYDSIPYFSLELDSGWNQIADPFAFAVAWNDIRFAQGERIYDHSSSLVEDSVYGFYDRGFRTQSVIFPWSGFFLFANQPEVKILFPFQEFTTSPPPQIKQAEVAVSGSWVVTCELIDGRTNAYRVFAHGGTRPEGALVETLRAPPSPDGTEFSISLTGSAEPALRSIQLLPAGGDYTFYLNAVCTGGGGTIRVLMSQNFPVELDIQIQSEAGISAAFSDSKSVKVSDGHHRFAVKIRSREPHESNRPVDFALYQNYPNPFNPQTTIEYDLPGPADCELKIFNILGQLAYRRSWHEQRPGHHVIPWNGRDTAGRSMASGIYFYRLTAGADVATRKMLLLK